MAIKVIFFDIGETLVSGDKQWVGGAKATLAELQTSGLESRKKRVIRTPGATIEKKTQKYHEMQYPCFH